MCKYLSLYPHRPYQSLVPFYIGFEYYSYLAIRIVIDGDLNPISNTILRYTLISTSRWGFYLR